MKRALVCCTVGACLLIASGASAQVKRVETRENESMYEFRDDLLNSDVAFPGGGTIVVRPKAARSLLIRPRTSFIQELFKSAENL